MGTCSTTEWLLLHLFFDFLLITGVKLGKPRLEVEVNCGHCDRQLIIKYEFHNKISCWLLSSDGIWKNMYRCWVSAEIIQNSKFLLVMILKKKNIPVKRTIFSGSSWVDFGTWSTCTSKKFKFSFLASYCLYGCIVCTIDVNMAFY